MFTLGLICHGQHEAAAVLLQDGAVIAAAEEERFSRHKFDSNFPREAIRFCLAQGGIGAERLSAVGFGFDPRRKLLNKAAHILRFWPDSLELVRTRAKFLSRMNGIVSEVRAGLRYTGPVLRLNHHLCHAASTFYASGFERASVLTLDGVGDWESIWWGLGESARLVELGTIDWPNSIGHVYSAFTEYLGFQPFSDEYKVMGLAPYGEPRYLDELARLLFPTPTGIGIDYRYFRYQVGGSPRYSQRLVELFGPPLKAGDTVPEHYRDIAASLQAQVERVICHLVERLTKETGCRDLCLAGGVAMNSVANGKILSDGLAARLYVPSCASDAGVALGAAYLAYQAVGGKLTPRRLDTALLGPEYPAVAIESALQAAGLSYSVQEDIAHSAARLIFDGHVVGWFQGRMEFGQRALGSRSILADPRRAEMKDIVNTKIKFRELFRPFAPAVLEERATEFFEIPPGAHGDFMTQVYLVRPEQHTRIPAVTHVDGSGRLQTVKQSTNPRYWRLIEQFANMSGVPVVLNTSFNVKGQPIVNTPSEAVETFQATEMDALAIGDFLAFK